ncbi:MAG: MarR family transcriptional regulator [Paracoccus sp. (in: a-proteobacteria)]|nr:MarR family transcriptional regulator [Paracoccus sp. (in: a-proteobacteria)]
MKNAGFDLTPIQFAALNAIWAHPGIDQASLAGMIAYDRATIGSVLDRLEAKGMVDRRISESDRRARQLTLTDLGARTLRCTGPIVRRLQADMLAGLSEQEREDFLRLARKAADRGNSLSRAPLVF